MKDEVAKKISEKILEAVGGNEVLAQILVSRGITEEEVSEFFNPDLYNPTAPEEFPGMEDAVDIVQRAVETGKKICIYGDYDVDGVTATALLVRVLRMLGAKVIYRVPDRFKEGYGMKEEVVSQLHEEEMDLILTCDCGISNVKEIELAKDLGVEVVVTDHHTLPPILPKADAIVNSQCLAQGHPARWVPGVAVAYFLAKALLRSYGREDEAEHFLDLVALGIIADVVVLRGAG
jgi:single-stranded-DNA-specific exonuclease